MNFFIVDFKEGNFNIDFYLCKSIDKYIKIL